MSTVQEEAGQRLLAFGDGKSKCIVPTGLRLVRYHQSTNPCPVHGIKSAAWQNWQAVYPLSGPGTYLRLLPGLVCRGMTLLISLGPFLDRHQALTAANDA